ncbi:ribosome maturation factor RimP [Corynebacterium lizhenjunii]|uniref:Ribosome maturation factor RimP n=1 Tax=Corynebacterium lizhenjunii TaxID=2709394 RepID=A0A7T0KCS6_9CORY|nr:ribosome maturation factor RimP [Corynebacterium lizhenjunii]QPK78398.1 ribosome maturation factor RimP [Corynebacterium lizhenjunii]
MAFPTTEALLPHVEPVAAAHGLDVEHIKATPAGKKSQVIIRVDGDARPTSDQLEQLSGQLSELFDQLESTGVLSFGAGYTLEVSTPGVDLPLTQPRHFRRNQGRLVRLGERRVRLGALSPAEDEVILIATNGKRLELSVERVENCAGAVVEIEFSTPSQSELDAVGYTFAQGAEVAQARG